MRMNMMRELPILIPSDYPIDLQKRRLVVELPKMFVGPSSAVSFFWVHVRKVLRIVCSITYAQ